jgi:hypothetical protein
MYKNNFIIRSNNLLASSTKKKFIAISCTFDTSLLHFCNFISLTFIITHLIDNFSTLYKKLTLIDLGFATYVTFEPLSI